MKALNNTGAEQLFKPLLLKMYPFRRVHVFPYLPWDIAWAERHRMVIANVFEILHLNKSAPLLRWFYKLMTIYLNPFQYVISFKKHVLKEGRQNIFYAN
jgi:hypothetical protein